MGRGSEGGREAPGKSSAQSRGRLLKRGKAPVLDAVGSDPMINWEPPGAPHLKTLQGSLGISFSISVAKDTGG